MFRNDAKSAVQFVFEQRKTWGKTNIHLRLIRKTLIKKYRWYFCSAFGPPGIRIRRPFRLFCVHPKLNRTPLTLCGRMGSGGIVPCSFRSWFYTIAQAVTCRFKNSPGSQRCPFKSSHWYVPLVFRPLQVTARLFSPGRSGADKITLFPFSLNSSFRLVSQRF